MKPPRADLAPPTPFTQGHVWIPARDPRAWDYATCRYCGCAKDSPAAARLCPNAGKEKHVD